jgi:hypothetical protein
VLTSDRRVVAVLFIVDTLESTAVIVVMSALLLTVVDSVDRSDAFAFPATVADSVLTVAMSTLVDNKLVIELA